MKAIHVVPRIHEEASGPSYTVPALCRSLADIGMDVDLLTLRTGSTSDKLFKAQAYPALPGLERLGVSPRLRRALGAVAREANIMHNHSVWMLPNVYPGRAVAGTECKLVFAPRGTFSPVALQRSWWLKCLVWRLGQRQTARQAACFHATAEREYREIRLQGFRRPVAVIPNGIDVPPARPLRAQQKTGSRILLYLGRIHPNKGLADLLQAWANVSMDFPDWELHIVGPDKSGYMRVLHQLVRKLDIQRTVFAGALYGSAKSEEYAHADLYVLPTMAENFGITVAEALSHGVPAITTRGAPWSGLEEQGCGWWIGVGEQPLTECLREAMSLSREELAARGEKGRSWLARDFSWSRIAEMVSVTYEWLVNGGTPPAWVRAD